MDNGIVRLQCQCKHDPWGKRGKDSLAARFWVQAQDQDEQAKISEDETYSEMWMGTYPVAPSKVCLTGEPLSTYLERNPSYVGQSMRERYGLEVPFLPKILSIAKALPLQIHPDKYLAEQLHRTDPEKFKDANHKPEIAIALSKFELFVGFKPLETIEGLLKLLPLQPFVPPHDRLDNEVLREVCKTLLTLPPKTVSEILGELRMLPIEAYGDHRQNIPSLLDRLEAQYSEFDNGNLVTSLLMNYMVLSPGEAVCVPADSIHAYLSGDIMECMAWSDNVLNAGFCTPANRDNVDVFVQALTFNPHSEVDALLPPRKNAAIGGNGRTEEYAPPFSEFNVLKTTLMANETEFHGQLPSLSIFIVTEGSGTLNANAGDENLVLDLHKGDVYFVRQGIELQLASVEKMVLYRAYATV